MLYDRGLAQDPEQYKKDFAESMRSRAKYGGCVGERLCEECNHIIADSICLCIGFFVCPNCHHTNDVRLAIQTFGNNFKWTLALVSCQALDCKHNIGGNCGQIERCKINSNKECEGYERNS